MNGRWVLVFCVIGFGCIDPPQPNSNNTTPDDAATDMAGTPDIIDMSSSDLPSLVASGVESSMAAIWTFEEDWSSTNGLHTFSPGGSISSQRNSPQGTQSLRVNQNQFSFLPEDEDLAMLGESGELTVGGWFREETTANAASFFRNYAYAAGGWSLTVNSGGLRCVTTSPGGGDVYSNAMMTAPRTEWNHIVCSFNYSGGSGTVTTYLNGEKVATSSQTVLAAPFDTSFTLGSRNAINFPFDGDFDEIFVSNQELPSALIAKIYACGVDGTLCLCSSSERRQYTSTGRAVSDELLAACQ